MKKRTPLQVTAIRLKSLLLMVCLLLAASPAFSQTKTVTGKVVDGTGEPLIGVTVQVEGTGTGVITDIDGDYSIASVSDDATLLFSYVGMLSQKVSVSGQTVINVTMMDDTQQLEEVVVIGYGSAKSKDLTAPITVVKGDELLATPSSSPMAALQGKVSGVNVVNSGAPGESPTVRIRGVGSFTESSPLYVVDGMFYDDISFLNSSDIQDMSVLKDASAAAIYGVRAANGVVIITTKKGTPNQKARISYNGYVGIQKATNVLEMCNASQYATMMLEGNYDAYNTYFKAAIDRWGGSYADSDFHNWTYGADSDWYDMLLREAVITDHSLSIDGGSEKTTYSMGVNYTYQNGVLKADNDYKRINFRAAADYVATNWLKVGFNGVFSNIEKQNPNNATWQHAFNCPPIIAAYDENNTDATPIKFGSPASIGYGSNFNNPLATAYYYDSNSNTYRVLSNFYAELTFIPEKLKLRTSYAYNYEQTSNRIFTPKYVVSGTQQQATNTLKKEELNYKDYVWDNVLTYTDRKGKHGWGAMFGYSMRQESYRYLWGQASNVPEGKDEYLYLNNGDASGATVGDDGTTYRGQSYFTRLNYNFDDKYLLMFTFRADGSSKYQEQWGYFPSVGAAWVISQEPFMQNQKAFNNLKLRASWGRLGNDKVAASDGFASLTTGTTASGVFGNTTIAGTQDNSYFSYLDWEVVDEWNAGINFATLQNRLSVDVDWYYRLTKKAVISPLLPFSTSTLAGNHGKILNTGFDIAINWADKVTKDFSYSIGVNLTTLKNRVKDLNGQEMIRGGKTVNWVGHEMNSYYGFVCTGVYQTEEECANDPLAVQEGCVPGDLKYADLNGDNKLDANDRTTLGSYIPNFTYGINLGLQYKNFDLLVSTYGQTGAQIFNRKRALRYASWDYNFDLAQYENRWTGPGTSNTDPSASALMRSHNVSDQRYSSYFVESADFFRIQNITLGYTFKNIKLGNYTLPGLRLSLTADRPFTTFSANTFSPEIADASAEGWDTEVYPLTATYTFGVKIDF